MKKFWKLAATAAMAAVLTLLFSGCFGSGVLKHYNVRVNGTLFDSAEPFAGNYAVVELDNKTKIIDKNFKLVSKASDFLSSDDITLSDITPDGYIAYSDKEGKDGLYSIKDGKIATEGYDNLGKLGNFLIAEKGDDLLILYGKGLNFKEIKTYKKSLAFSFYTFASMNTVGMMLDYMYGIDPDYVIAISGEKADKPVLVDKNGKETGNSADYTIDAYSIPYGFYGKLLAVKDKDNKYGFIDKKGAVKIAMQYKYAEMFDGNGLAVVQKDNDKYVLINTSGKEISGEYDRISGNASPLYAIVKKGKTLAAEYTKDYLSRYKNLTKYYEVGIKDDKGSYKYGLINKSGKVLMDTVYDDSDFEAGLFIFKKAGAGKYEYFSGALGKTVTSQYDLESDFVDGYALASDSKGRTFLIDKNDKLLIDNQEFVFDTNLFNAGYMMVGDNAGNKIIINKKGKVCAKDKTLDPISLSNGYTSLGSLNFYTFSEGTYPDRIYGIVNAKGETIVSAQYKDIDYGGDGYLMYKNKDDKYGYMKTR